MNHPGVNTFTPPYGSPWAGFMLNNELYVAFMNLEKIFSKEVIYVQMHVNISVWPKSNLTEILITNPACKRSAGIKLPTLSLCLTVPTLGFGQS